MTDHDPRILATPRHLSIDYSVGYHGTSTTEGPLHGAHLTINGFTGIGNSVLQVGAQVRVSGGGNVHWDKYYDDSALEAQVRSDRFVMTTAGPTVGVAFGHDSGFVALRATAGVGYLYRGRTLYGLGHVQDGTKRQVSEERDTNAFIFAPELALSVRADGFFVTAGVVGIVGRQWHSDPTTDGDLSLGSSLRRTPTEDNVFGIGGYLGIGQAF